MKRESQQETTIEGVKPSSIVFEETTAPVINFFLAIIIGLLFIIASIIWLIIQYHEYWIGLGVMLCGVLLAFAATKRLYSYITEIKFDEEALYIRRSARVRQYQKIPWSQIENIRVRIDWLFWNSYLIWIDATQTKQVIPYWLGPFWPSKYEKDIRESFFTEIRRKLDEEKERRKQKSGSNLDAPAKPNEVL